MVDPHCLPNLCSDSEREALEAELVERNEEVRTLKEQTKALDTVISKKKAQIQELTNDLEQVLIVSYLTKRKNNEH